MFLQTISQHPGVENTEWAAALQPLHAEMFWELAKEFSRDGFQQNRGVHCVSSVEPNLITLPGIDVVADCQDVVRRFT